MRERFLDPETFAAFCEGFVAEMRLLRGEHIAQRAAARRELEGVAKEIGKLIQAIKDGVPALAIKDELMTLEARKVALTRAAAETPPAALHPNMAEVFRRKAAALASGLQHVDQRDSAREALRGFVEKIVIPPGEEMLTVVGKLGAMLDAAAGQEMSGRQAVAIVGCGGRI